MKKTTKYSLIALISGVMVSGLVAQGPDGTTNASTVGVFKEEKKTVTETLKGKLFEVEGGEAKDSDLGSQVEYIVVYHSASW